MPCVLPVLSFKALGLAQASRSHAHAQAHALWYTAGILASFALIGALVLGLRGAGQALGWGFQLQQPAVVGALTLLMFAIGLSLSGVFQFGASLAGVGQSLTEKSGASRRFLHRRARRRGRQSMHRAVHGRRARLCLRRAGAVGDAGVPDAGPRAGHAVPADRFRAGAGLAHSEAGRVDGDAQAVAGFPDVLHGRLAGLGVRQAARRRCAGAAVDQRGAAGDRPVVVRATTLRREPGQEVAGLVAAGDRTWRAGGRHAQCRRKRAARSRSMAQYRFPPAASPNCAPRERPCSST